MKKSLKKSEKTVQVVEPKSNTEENFAQIQEIAKEIVRELGFCTKVVDWNRKEYLKAKIRAAVKNLLIKGINGRTTYKEIEKLSSEVISHAETVYLLQQHK